MALGRSYMRSGADNRLMMRSDISYRCRTWKTIPPGVSNKRYKNECKSSSVNVVWQQYRKCGNRGERWVGQGLVDDCYSVKKVPVSVFLCQKVGYECIEGFCGWRHSFLILNHKVYKIFVIFLPRKGLSFIKLEIWHHSGLQILIKVLHEFPILY